MDFVSAIIHKSSPPLQQLVGGLEDPQVEVHLLRSCLCTCKVSYILQTVPRGDVDIYLKQFDSNLRSNLSHILRCPISDSAWLKATLPDWVDCVSENLSVHPLQSIMQAASV